MYPDFLGIGAQKAGTTWLYRNLRAHPGIWMPPRKEIHYFDGEARRRAGRAGDGKPRDRKPRDRAADRQARQARARDREKFGLGGATEDPRWHARFRAKDRDDRWYASLFEPGRGKVTGEITPSYSILDHDAVARVHGLMPEAKIIFFMRNPVERVFSQVVMRFDRRDPDSASSTGSRRLIRRAERDNNRTLTDYLRTLRTWGSSFPEDRIFVGFLEDMHLFPEELLERLYAFLGVDPSFKPPDPEEKIHARSVGRMPRKVAAHLAGSYHGEISDLSETFGGYANFWLHCAEKLAEETTDEDVAYPFDRSSLWQDWVNRAGQPRQAQSGPLDRIRPNK